MSVDLIRAPNSKLGDQAVEVLGEPISLVPRVEITTWVQSYDLFSSTVFGFNS